MECQVDFFRCSSGLVDDYLPNIENYRKRVPRKSGPTPQLSGMPPTAPATHTDADFPALGSSPVTSASPSISDILPRGDDSFGGGGVVHSASTRTTAGVSRTQRSESPHNVVSSHPTTSHVRSATGNPSGNMSTSAGVKPRMMGSTPENGLLRWKHFSCRNV